MFNLFNRMTVVLACLLFVATTYAHTNVVVIPLGDDAPKPIEYAIGDTGPAGGIVFHVTDGGLHGLEAAPGDQGLAPWNCDGDNVLGVINLANSTDADPKSGAVNTSFISAQCPGDEVPAAVLAAVYIWPNGQTGGFLPNKEELDLLDAQKDVVGNFTNGINNSYWSSSEYNADNAWFTSLANDDQLINSKSNLFGVRAVRAF